MKIPTRQTKNAAGFTLVEIALALLVVAIGLVVVVGLFPSGLKANKISIDETQMAMVADEILNGVKALASEKKWDDMKNGNFSLPTPAKNFWVSNPLLIVRPATPSGNQTRTARVLTYDDGTKIDAYGHRYNLQIVPVPGAPNILGVKLQLWNGEQGPLDKGSVFYTEIYYNGIP